MTGPAYPVVVEPVGFGDLDGWQTDDHAAALACFMRSAGTLANVWPAARELSERARLILAGSHGDGAAREFFEHSFVPHEIRHDGAGFVTGYYEPVLAGSRTRSAAFPVPLYRRPDDLVTLVDDALRGAAGTRLTHARRTSVGDVPFPTRREIEEGALAGFGLEICWLADLVDAFFLHVQGSGVVEFAGEAAIRVGYDGKNGHPYTSVGQVLIAAGEIAAADMSLATLRAWLAAQPDRARRTLWHNASFVFFCTEPFEACVGPCGVHGIRLTEGRSLAVDASVHTIGLPVHVSVPGLADRDAGGRFHRLMIAQDVGSAITGPERGDIFFGTGPIAGESAGATRHRAKFHVMLPREARSS
ncbi:MAG: MltA domain-containing protein [Hyphomicrobiaceae bacterium]